MFGRRKEKKKAIAFVDYEYWFYSYKTRFHLRPNPAAWRASLEEKYDIADILVFADFSSPGLSDELNSLREITNTIIETGDDFQRKRKDMTDFVMLDYIYQSVDEHKRIRTYILFTGDGHFQSVVKYLTQKKHKTVVLYGIEDSFSKRLVSPASEVVMLPSDVEQMASCAKYIIQDLAHCARSVHVIPTIKSTAEKVARQYSLPFEEVRSVIVWMLKKGYLYQRDQRIEFNHSVKVIVPNWEMLIHEKIWDAKAQKVLRFPM